MRAEGERSASWLSFLTPFSRDSARLLLGLSALSLLLPTDDHKLIGDLAEVREMLDDLQRPFFKPENGFFAPTEEGGASLSSPLMMPTS